MHERDHARELGALRSGLAATAVLCVVELVGGYLTNSLALVSDAAHMFTDMAALGLTLFALWICSRPASETKTFGYYRAEILAALVNGVVLWVIVVFIVAEAWRRLHDPPPVAGRGLLALALLGLVVNAVVALRLRALRARRGGGRPRRGRRHPGHHGRHLRARLPHRARDHPDRAREPPGR